MTKDRTAIRKVLVVDDELPMRQALDASFRRQNWIVQTASGVEDAAAKFQAVRFPLVITDMRMPDGDGMELMRRLRAIAPQTAVIMLTAYGSIPDAVVAMKTGACDYLVKPVSFDQLHAAATRILCVSADAQEDSQPEMIGRSDVFLQAISRAQRVAESDADILVEAESGTGKELLARMIHGASRRSRQPLVAVNCAALPENLLESELFGHARGAFTGANTSRTGKFEQADGGTLLLDEIGEMPLSLQPKLLRALQEREFDPLGDTRTVKVNIRVIATTNRSLRSLVAEGRFRADLFYRLHVIPLSLPPLRERKSDVAELAGHFARKYLRARQRLPEFSPEFIDGMESYSWPGNVRELANFMQRVTALCTEPVVGPEYLDPSMRQRFPAGDATPDLRPGASLRDVERRLLQMTLDATDGNRTRAAEMLGVSLRTVRNKIRNYGLPPRSFA